MVARLSLALGLLLAACARAPASDCAWVKPILVSRADVLSAGTAGQIVAHNRKWERFCER